MATPHLDEITADVPTYSFFSMARDSANIRGDRHYDAKHLPKDTTGVVVIPTAVGLYQVRLSRWHQALLAGSLH